uniref:Store-operated calcium entry-associated regulatory factor n=1 Tax=Oncorhynchus tshawytscha TaxID=74940 RepID=A0A8C8FRR2_ONCTS
IGLLRTGVKSFSLMNPLSDCLGHPEKSLSGEDKVSATISPVSSAVPQLQCAGGSASCGSFISEVVQCKNKGWDRVNAQCKTDMDSAYKFGRIEVSCEGFSHPDDAYILKGSCGLEYSLELTEEGKRRHKRGSTGGFSDFVSSFKGSSNNNNQHHHYSSGLVIVALLLFLAYGVYKLFLSGPTNLLQDWQFPDNGYNPHGPPPPGLRKYSDYKIIISQYNLSDIFISDQ